VLNGRVPEQGRASAKGCAPAGRAGEVVDRGGGGGEGFETKSRGVASEENGGEGGAIPEGGVANVSDAVADGDGSEDGAIPEGVGAYAGDTIRDDDGY